jgi:hypothetical protein
MRGQGVRGVVPDLSCNASENTGRRDRYPFVTDLERSHSGLRAAVIIAGREIRRLNFGRRDNLVLVKMREVVRDTR